MSQVQCTVCNVDMTMKLPQAASSKTGVASYQYWFHCPTCNKFVFPEEAKVVLNPRKVPVRKPRKPKKQPERVMEVQPQAQKPYQATNPKKLAQELHMNMDEFEDALEEEMHFMLKEQQDHLAKVFLGNATFMER